ncbi:hypothetical protein T440DRAFT_470672 [Plenodomus tracheiphilus IPT5]|uniref:DUF7730 domain-containing protein n=1 Tax=Plenodomus tracheiphilus IPT5 TaxID=1408161 RepID=A0A6A7B0J4_9PLEO|nr:hypothetical protein T440DRAFT_470672 [Plenodomus tracheiphilus IPT5]
MVSEDSSELDRCHAPVFHIAQDEIVAGAKSAITLKNFQSSLFLQLPGELRNRIYGYVLNNLSVHLYSQYKPCSAASCQTCQAPKDDWPIVHIHSYAVALSQVCRAVHAETQFLPSNLTELHGNMSILVLVLERRPIFTAAQLATLAVVYIELDDESCDRSYHLIRNGLSAIARTLVGSCTQLERMVLVFKGQSWNEEVQELRRDRVFNNLRSRVGLHLHINPSMNRIAVEMMQM